MWQRISLIRPNPASFCKLLLLLLAMGVAEEVSAQGLKFTSPVTYPAGSPYVLTSGDFNGDGKVDLVAGDISHGDLVMLLGNGDGTLKAPITYHLTAALATGDANGDGKIDLIIGMRNIPSFVSVLLGNGDGTFQAPISSNSNATQNGTGPYAIVVGDFDRDGKLDVALSDEVLKILKGNGDGTFKPPSFNYRLRNTATDLKSADFNGD